MLTGRQRLYLEAIGIDLWVSRAPPGEARVVAVPAAPIRAPAVPDEVAAAEWQRLSDEVRGCRLCPLHATRTQGVLGVGPKRSDWLVIGEAPGAEEDRRGEPFVGAAGQLLDAMLRAIGLDRRTNVYIANVLKSRPPNNRDPKPEEVEACLPYLVRQIALLLEPHPVGGGMARRLAALDGAGHGDGAAKQQQLLGQGGLAGIRVRDDREGPSPTDFGIELGHVVVQGVRDWRRCAAHA